jgi:hypothetical protein
MHDTPNDALTAKRATGAWGTGGAGLPTLRNRLKEAAATHGEKVLAELPATLRRIRTLLLVAAISLPLFLIGVLVILARLIR